MVTISTTRWRPLNVSVVLYWWCSMKNWFSSLRYSVRSTIMRYSALFYTISIITCAFKKTRRTRLLQTHHSKPYIFEISKKRYPPFCVDLFLFTILVCAPKYIWYGSEPFPFFECQPKVLLSVLKTSAKTRYYLLVVTCTLSRST